MLHLYTISVLERRLAYKDKFSPFRTVFLKVDWLAYS